MSAPWRSGHDPDLGEEPGSKYLGRRVWNWFTGSAPGGVQPHDVEPATSPWAPSPTVAPEHRDRTLGIPERHISMWPPTAPREKLALPIDPEPAASRPGTPDAERLQAILEELRAIPRQHESSTISPGLLTELLTALAPQIHNRPETAQYVAVSSIARKHDVGPDTLLDLAERTGKLIAQTTHTPAPTAAGRPNLNRLLGANLATASHLLLARTTLTHASAYSDPDLPRLWILANALHHTVPVATFTTQPAQSHGLHADLLPTHDDLLNWPGIRTAIEQLDATATAANTGRLWIDSLTGVLTPDDRRAALGILHLTHPRTAFELALTDPDALTASTIHAIADHLPPASVATLSDSALKAVCDRNHWLLGASTERAQREIVERHLTDAMTDDVRAQLAAGNTLPLTEALSLISPGDQDLDRAIWRTNPPDPDIRVHQRLLEAVSSQAIFEFTGMHIEPRPSMSAALAGRFPERCSQIGLRVSRDELLGAPTEAPAIEPVEAPLQLGLDFGL